MCEKFFRSKNFLKFHLCQYQRSLIYICAICDKKFLTKPTEKKTFEKKTSSDRQSNCNMCVKFFRSKNFLKFHLCQYQRSLIYICAICDKKFLTKSTMRKYMTMKNSRMQESLMQSMPRMNSREVKERQGSDNADANEAYI